MSRLALALATSLAVASPAASQEAEPEEGSRLVERGIDLMMRGLLSEVAPALGDIERTMMLLEGVIGRIGAYQAPELLPNGDILIRRKIEGGPEAGPEVAPEDGEVDL